MHGERSNEEKIQLEKRIEELSTELDNKNLTYTLLNAQLKRLQVSRAGESRRGDNSKNCQMYIVYHTWLLLEIAKGLPCIIQD